MKRQQISRYELASYLLSPSLFVMVTLMVVEAMLAAATTWLVINAGRKVAIGQFLLSDLIWILTAQSASYVVGVISWIFAERAGYRGFGKFMLRFARENRGKVKLLNEKPAREQVEPFLTGETFQCFFNVMYELEFALKLFLGLVFNALVLGTEIDPYQCYSQRSTLPTLEQIATYTLELFPQLHGLRVLRQWTGPCDMTPDFAPIIGRAQELENFYQDVGWGTWGFKAAPGAAKAVAQLVATGRTPALLEPFSPGRFYSGRMLGEKAAAAVSA